MRPATQTRLARLDHAIRRLERLYKIRKVAGKRYEWLLARCAKLTRCYLDELRRLEEVTA